MPSSFKGETGKVIFFLEAKLSRSMLLSTKDKTEFTFVSRTDMHVPDMKVKTLFPLSVCSCSCKGTLCDPFGVNSVLFLLRRLSLGLQRRI